MLCLLRFEEYFRVVLQLASRGDQAKPGLWQKTEKEGPAQPFPLAAGLPSTELHLSPSRTFSVFKQQQTRPADNKPASDGPNTKETAQRGTGQDGNAC